MATQDHKIKESTLKIEPVGETEGHLDTPRVQQTKTLLTWKAPLRVFKKRDREFWSTTISVAILIGIILVFIREWMLLAAIISFLFVYYVYSNTPSDEVEHEITNRSIVFAGREYLWDDVLRYWFTKNWDKEILNIELKAGFPRRLQFLLGSTEQKKIKDILDKYVLAEVPKPSFLDKASDWLSKKVPLETN